jgi:hypothetical protein
VRKRLRQLLGMDRGARAGSPSGGVSEPPARSGDATEPRDGHAQAPSPLLCSWCNKASDPEQDGFHLCHVAFGGFQERYCFCSDECYEAFRKMYPARVHRNCYERDCADCDLCVKRYPDEADDYHALTRGRAGRDKGPGRGA